MPTAPGKVMREIVELCEEVGVACRSMPGIYELLDGRMSISRYPSTVPSQRTLRAWLRASPPGEDRRPAAA
ncbi:MAG: hypothetical protein QMD04_12900 [Anaerolineales bacterium]|nr:hypothetical protein [Anaerolineales bacterium]